MRSTYSEEEQLLAQSVRDIAAHFPDEYWMTHDDRGQYPVEFAKAFAERGYFGISIPEQYGGVGCGITEAAIVLREIAASGAAMNGCSTIHFTMFAANVLVKHASEELREGFLPKIASGEIELCFSVTEQDAGTDTSRISTIARREGPSYIVTGRKLWTSKAQEADIMVLLARTQSRDEVETPTDGLTLLLVDMSSDGIEIRPIKKMGRNAVDSNEVFLDDVEVPINRRIGAEGAGFRHILDSLNPERILLAHESIGIGEAALERAVPYAQERVVFGRPIGKNQGVQFPLAEAYMRLNAAELMARHAAQLYDSGQPCGPEANMAKFLAADAGYYAADCALQAHGGLGYAQEFHVERYFREARLMLIAPVTQEMVLSYVGTHVLGLPRSY